MATSYELDMDEEMFQYAFRVAEEIARNPSKLGKETFLRATIASCAVFGSLNNTMLNLLDEVEEAYKAKDREKTKEALEDLMHFHQYARHLCSSSAGMDMSERIAKKLKEKK